MRLPASTSCCKQHSYLAGRGPNSNALHPPLAAVVAVAPTQWQNYCKARGRTSKEVKEKIKTLENAGKKESKILSIQFVKEKFHIDTDNDNLSDAICIGHYAVNHFEIEGKTLHVKEKQ